MSGVYPVFERETPGVQPELEVTGKTLSWSCEELEALAQQLGLPTLISFFSTDEDEVRGLIGADDDEDAPLGFEVVEEWFSPADGLRTVRGLRDYICNNPEWATGAKWARGKPEAVQWLLEDLSGTEAMLSLAEQNGTRFHFAIDV